MIRRTLFSLLFLLLSYVSVGQRITQSMDRNWRFSFGWQATSAADTRLPRVNLPHTWNLDALAGIPMYYRGQGNYLREFQVPAEWSGTQRVYLRFGAVNSVAEVYVNGRRVGAHQGGYTAFGFDITPYLIFNGRNTLWVRANNSIDLNVMPLVGNFNHYGGIYRSVELITTPNTHLSMAHYATNGVRIEQSGVSTQSATVSVEASLQTISARTAKVRMLILDGAGQEVASTTKDVRFSSDNHAKVRWELEIENPRLWHGTHDPHLYRAVVQVNPPQEGAFDSTKINKIAQYDEVVQTFGLRTFQVNSRNQFLLNGKPYEIRGVTKMQDNSQLGGAIYRQDMERDMKLITEMGANAVRLSYGPHDKYFLDLCDREGIIVWSDLPFVGPGKYRDTGFNDSEEFRQNGIQQLSEMIAQQYNHPSVMFWGLYNELSQRGCDPLPYLRTLNQIAKQEDPSRLTTASSNQDGELNFVTDLIGFNLYMGWDQGMPRDIEQWGNSVRSDWPRLKVALSEYGAGGSIYQHQSDLKKPVVESYWHPEEWQTYVHQESYKVIRNRGFFWGTFVSSMFDWGMASKRQGTRAGIVDLGLVTFDRAVRKDAFYFYKANWNKLDLFVHITSARFVEREGLTQDFKIFSNCKSVSLTLNGSFVETIESPAFGTFEFKGCKMLPGRNLVEVKTESGQTDSVVLEITQ